MNKTIIDKWVLLIVILSLGCKNRVGNDENKSILKQVDVIDSINNTVYESVKIKKKDNPTLLLEDHVILENDTIIIKDEVSEEGGKVWGISKFNSEIYYYKTFKSKIKETDIGKSFIKVKNKEKELLWIKEIDRETIINDNHNYIIFIDHRRHKIIFHDAISGSEMKIKTISESIQLGDTDYVANKEGLYFKLVNEDYSFKRIMFINNKDWSQNYFEFPELIQKYVSLRKKDGKVVILDNDNNLLKTLE